MSNHLNVADLDRTGTRYQILGCYVYGDIDWFAYSAYLDNPAEHRMMWWDLSPNHREQYRAEARDLLASFGG